MTHNDSCPAGPLGPLFGECNCPTKGIEKCWCGKTFFWQDRDACEAWVRDHIHAEPAGSAL